MFLAAPGQLTLGLRVKTGSGYVVMLGASAFRNDGSLLGVVLVVLDAARMRKILTHIPRTFETASVRKGVRVGDDVRYPFDSRSGNADVNMRRALTGESGYAVLYVPDGDQLLVAFRPVGYGGKGLVSEVDADEAWSHSPELTSNVTKFGRW